ncbi:MAG: TIGR04086 family membrane protein [Acutalibacteraceae bacterium]
MSKKSRNQNSSNNIKKTVFFKTLFLQALLSLLVLILVSFITYFSSADRRAYFYIAVLSFALISFICGYYSGYKIHENGLLTGLLYCLPVNIVVVLISLATNRFKADATLIISAFVLIICSMLGGVVSVNTKMKVKNKRKGR